MKISEIEQRLRAILSEEMEEVSNRVMYKLVREIWQENLSPKEIKDERPKHLVERHP